ncbi:MAG: hypothetical protein JWL77_4689 [Chthonomonadaceae bacterium]|nr:hypothetical protein [Chthonomonadaceae bacterium]
MLLLPGIFVWKAYRQEQLDCALLIAIKHNATKTAVSLLAAGADANAKDLPTGSRVMWQRLWDRLRGKRPPTKTAQSALLLAVEGLPGTGVAHENVPLIKALLDKGADVNARDEGRMTPLLAAVVNQHPVTVRLLLDHGANVNIKDNGSDTLSDNLDGTGKPLGTWHHPGLTALQHADDLDNLEMMRLLLEHGADANVRLPYGNTLLIQAAGSGDSDKIRLLLPHGAKVDATDSDGSTALMHLARSAYTGTMLLLLKQGADVNARDHEGETALMYSTDGVEDDPATLQLLLKWGADAHLKNRAGKTALSIAQDGNRFKSIHFLIQSGMKE